MKTQIFINDGGSLSFYGDTLASQKDYEMADRCIGSIFEAVEPGEDVVLFEGIFCLDENLDLKENNNAEAFKSIDNTY